MWVVFRKSDKKVIGTSARSSAQRDLNKDVALRQTVRGKLEEANLDDFDAIQVKDPQEADLFIARGRRQTVVLEEQQDGSLKPTLQKQETFLLDLRSDAKELHPVDGVPLIPADGKSAAEITIQKVDEQGRPVARAQDNDELWLRTNHGTLLDTQGNPVRALKLSRGEAAFRLQSETARRLATVQVFNAEPDLEDAAIAIEFV